MSPDPFHFQMMRRTEEMTRAERLYADEQAARMAHGLWSLARAIRRVAGALRRPVLLDPRCGEATMQPRRSS